MKLTRKEYDAMMEEFIKTRRDRTAALSNPEARNYTVGDASTYPRLPATIDIGACPDVKLSTPD